MMAIGSVVERGGQPRARISLVDVSSGSTIRPIDPVSADVSDLEFTEDSSRLMAVVDSVAVAVWDVPTGRSVVHTDESGQPATITTSAFSRHGDGFAIGRADGTVEIWSRQGSSWARSSAVRRHADAVTWIEFDPSDA